ncbi:MAG: hypothetical protein JNM56_21780 [Planctomycetia bacterium]|nr:hypothetical protein [Planctomycetia bacterium]
MALHVQLQDIEVMRCRAGIDDVALRSAIRSLQVGHLVRGTFMTGPTAFTGETLSVRNTGIDGQAFRGVLSQALAPPELAQPRPCAAVAFTTNRVHSVVKRRPPVLTGYAILARTKCATRHRQSELHRQTAQAVREGRCFARQRRGRGAGSSVQPTSQEWTMFQCHMCGKNLVQDKRIQRSVQTSTTAAGDGFFRTVNLCPRCDKSTRRKLRTALLIKIGFAAAVLGGVLASGAYLLFMR